ncbi:hypothetical protein EYF80_040051 [Liparis tanakae]|uniref:Uncharacterized protein n=1 Tax=Liparis tanakae TaxID=230148 RepID=A0A4Z2G8C6_9TELE|nr:hypothetical protein EYF80_040051 [Liparis tanakae]
MSPASGAREQVLSPDAGPVCSGMDIKVLAGLFTGKPCSPFVRERGGHLPSVPPSPSSLSSQTTVAARARLSKGTLCACRAHPDSASPALCRNCADTSYKVPTGQSGSI